MTYTEGSEHNLSEVFRFQFRREFRGEVFPPFPEFDPIRESILEQSEQSSSDSSGKSVRNK